MKENNKTDFLQDALPFIYKAEFSGKVTFYAGAFSRLIISENEEAVSPMNLKNLFGYLGMKEDVYSSELASLRDGKITSIRKKVALRFFGEEKRFLWISTVASDGCSYQGQFIDIEELEQYQDRFDRLRELTYGSLYFGHQIAQGRESARMRDMSVMFVDAVDSTQKIFSLDPGKAKEYVEDLAAMITSTVKEHKGFMDKFLGDGAMVLWGYQITEDGSLVGQPIDAVNAARAMLKKAQKYNIDKPASEQIHLRIGIDFGKIFAGSFENKDRIIFTAVGKAVNVAARLEDAADMDSIFVTHAYLEKIAKNNPGVVASTECRVIKLKGIPYGVNCCKLV